jgi:hypothetical protein
VELEDVEAATSLVEYFKAHARRAYVQLYGESREDRLLADLTKILKENQGRWEDDPKKGWEDPASKLYEALKARGFDALPPRPDWINLYKAWEVVCDAAGDLHQVVKNGWADEDERRRFTGTAQSRAELGDEARHASEKYRAPKNPMTLYEAQSFVRSVIQAWVQAL